MQASSQYKRSKRSSRASDSSGSSDSGGTSGPTRKLRGDLTSNTYEAGSQQIINSPTGPGPNFFGGTMSFTGGAQQVFGTQNTHNYYTSPSLSASSSTQSHTSNVEEEDDEEEEDLPQPAQGFQGISQALEEKLSHSIKGFLIGGHSRLTTAPTTDTTQVTVTLQA